MNRKDGTRRWSALSELAERSALHQDSCFDENSIDPHSNDGWMDTPYGCDAATLLKRTAGRQFTKRARILFRKTPAPALHQPQLGARRGEAEDRSIARSAFNGLEHSCFLLPVSGRCRLNWRVSAAATQVSSLQLTGRTPPNN